MLKTPYTVLNILIINRGKTGWSIISNNSINRTPTRQNFSGPVPNTVLLPLLAADRLYGSVMRPSQPAITYASSVTPSHLTSALTSTSQIRAFTGFARSEEFVVRLTPCPQRHWSTRSSHHGLTAATPCLPVQGHH